MDERLKTALEEGARNGALEIYEKHDEYVRLMEEAEEEYKKKVWSLGEQYGENETLYNVAQSVLEGIVGKLERKEQ